MKSKNCVKGKQGEDLALVFLKNKHYEILERNYRCSLGEIDLIAKDQEVLIFVEVKYRRNLDYGYPREAVHLKKQKRIGRAALFYLKEKHLEEASVRFDVIEIYFDDQGEQVINHFDHAFGLRQ